jgi:molybdopterin-guanine dinucleotide biosynthesis protein A
MPNVDPRLPLILARAQDADAVVPRWDNGWIEPLCAIYSHTALPVIVRQLGEGRLRMTQLHDELDCVTYIDVEPLMAKGELDTDSFVNINSPTALEEWLEGLPD